MFKKTDKMKTSAKKSDELLTGAKKIDEMHKNKKLTPNY